MHKFILGENPQAPESGGLWIIHLVDPIAIIEVVADGKKQHTRHVEYESQLIYHNTDGDEEDHRFYVHHFFTTDFNLVDEKLGLEKVHKLLNQAMHWYKSYLTWQDKQID